MDKSDALTAVMAAVLTTLLNGHLAPAATPASTSQSSEPSGLTIAFGIMVLLFLAVITFALLSIAGEKHKSSTTMLSDIKEHLTSVLKTELTSFSSTLEAQVAEMTTIWNEKFVAQNRTLTNMGHRLAKVQSSVVELQAILVQLAPTIATMEMTIIAMSKPHSSFFKSWQVNSMLQLVVYRPAVQVNAPNEEPIHDSSMLQLVVYQPAVQVNEPATQVPILNTPSTHVQALVGPSQSPASGASELVSQCSPAVAVWRKSEWWDAHTGYAPWFLRTPAKAWIESPVFVPTPWIARCASIHLQNTPGHAAAAAHSNQSLLTKSSITKPVTRFAITSASFTLQSNANNTSEMYDEDDETQDDPPLAPTPKLCDHEYNAPCSDSDILRLCIPWKTRVTQLSLGKRPISTRPDEELEAPVMDKRRYPIAPRSRLLPSERFHPMYRLVNTMTIRVTPVLSIEFSKNPFLPTEILGSQQDLKHRVSTEGNMSYALRLPAPIVNQTMASSTPDAIMSDVEDISASVDTPIGSSGSTSTSNGTNPNAASGHSQQTSMSAAQTNDGVPTKDMTAGHTRDAAFDTAPDAPAGTGSIFDELSRSVGTKRAQSDQERLLKWLEVELAEKLEDMRVSPGPPVPPEEHVHVDLKHRIVRSDVEDDHYKSKWTDYYMSKLTKLVHDPRMDIPTWAPVKEEDPSVSGFLPISEVVPTPCMIRKRDAWLEKQKKASRERRRRRRTQAELAQLEKERVNPFAKPRSADQDPSLRHHPTISGLTTTQNTKTMNLTATLQRPPCQL